MRASMSIEAEEEKQLMQKIARVLDESRASHAIQIRKLKELSNLRSSSPLKFLDAFSKTLSPVFSFQRRIASVERIVRFVAIFATTRSAKSSEYSDGFLQEFLRFLIVGTTAANRTARFRACQIISEIIMRLPDDAEVSDELWDEVIESMKLRVQDKVPIVRTFAVRALSRFANDSENSDILQLLLEILPLEQNPDVRKTIVLSLPPTNATSTAIIRCTLDVSESVRKACYCVLASKFPLQSLSIKLRTLVLQRGLSDRSVAVTKECLRLMKDEWLVKCCNGDPIELLKYLDVETYESVGVSVMEALLNAGLIKVSDDKNIKQFLVSTNDTTEGHSCQRMEAEVALYWRTLCKYLQKEAQAKGSDAAVTMGTESAVYAAEASESNDLLDKILPVAVSEYIELVKAHMIAGPNYHFTSRQLLLLGTMLDFSDATNRKVAGVFVLELLRRPHEHETDENGNKVVLGDGISLGGEKDWADAVIGLAKKVHAAPGEFEEVFLKVIEELAQPCRERTADFLQWMHCLSVTGLLLENTKSFRWMHGRSIEPAELLQSLLLPAAKHAHLDVQRAATRCLGLFGLLERNPSEELIKQLRISLIRGLPPINSMAAKALIDLGMWHGPQEVDKSLNRDLSSQFRDNAKIFYPVNLNATNEDLDIELLDLLYTGLERNGSADTDENESVQAVLAEGFAKVLLLSESYPSIHVSSHPLLLAKLIRLYFCSDTSELQRLKQCLSVFFEHYPSLSVNHKKCILKAFIPAIRSMWPGIDGNTTGSSIMVSNMRKRAVQASRFMLQMLQAPLYTKEDEQVNENGSENLQENVDESTNSSNGLEHGEEGLAICIAAEVASFPKKKNAAEKAYISAISRVLSLLRFRPSQQGPIKLMRMLLSRVVESISTDKEIVKELKRMADQLKALDRQPDEPWQPQEVTELLGKLEIEVALDESDSFLEIPPTPAPRSSRPVRPRRRVRNKEESSSSEEETSPTSVVPCNTGTASIRSQRASKTAALSKLASANRSFKISNIEEDQEDEEDSEVTSDDNSDGSDESF